MRVVSFKGTEAYMQNYNSVKNQSVLQKKYK